MLDYRRGRLAGRIRALASYNRAGDEAGRVGYIAARRRGHSPEWLAGYDDGVKAIETAPRATDVRARALAPASPHDSLSVRAQRTTNVLTRVDTRLRAWSTAGFSVVLTVLVAAVVVADAHTPLSRVIIVAVALACIAVVGWWLPRRTVRAGLAEAEVTAAARRDYRAMARTSGAEAGWLVLQLIGLLGPSLVLGVLAGHLH